jgi:MFS transporter, PAT family, beta-lactamase induction signal transducer AmpG
VEPLIFAPASLGARVDKEKLSGFRLLASAMHNRKTAIMFVFGFAAGLPYTLLLGTLYAWLGEAKVNLATIGILSWIGLAYAFKFLWSPLVDRVNLPVLGRMGRRRGWLLVCQVLLAATFILLSFTDPVIAIGWFALIAVTGAFASATQDVVIDAWRIDVADEVATLEILSTIYQFGYRVSALVGGALALVLAARISWPTVYAVMGGLMLIAVVATVFAPDTARPPGDGQLAALRQPGAIDPRLRAIGLAVVAAGWAWAIITIAVFMIRVLMASPDDPLRPMPGDFTRRMGPWIVFATVIVPSLVAAYFNWLRERGRDLLKQPVPVTSLSRAADHAYSALILPLAELVGRLKWGAIVALGLILSYRLCDSIWGPFAFPFYLEELKYTNDEVAFASKIFGVFMTMAGIAMGGIMFATLGRMPTLMIGAATAAASNLLYADLAAGAPVIDAFSNMFGLRALGEALGTDMRMIRLLVAISGENITGGLAGAAFVAYLSSIASKTFSAVQYALLSSLTFLVGSLGRGALGEAIQVHGYAPVFKFTAALGLIAVVFCLVEWVRTASQARREARVQETAPVGDAVA